MSRKNNPYTTLDKTFVAFCMTKGVKDIETFVNDKDDDMYRFNDCSNLEELQNEFKQITEIQKIDLWEICHLYLKMFNKLYFRKTSKKGGF